MKIVIYAVAFTVLFASPAPAELRRGVINDPDGFVNVRAGESTESAVVARVKEREPFKFQCEQEAQWCKVTLRSGVSGWMHRSRIRLHFTDKDLPVRDPSGLSEIDEFAKGRGLDYANVTRRAARAEANALRDFFAMAKDVDGAAAESYYGTPTVVYHLLGDEKFARFLRDQPLTYRMRCGGRFLATAS